MFIIHGGGRAGPHEWGWVAAGYNLDEVEYLRLQLLARNDYGAVQKTMRQVGITVDRAVLRLVKRYNFDSLGVGFLYKNYQAWRNLVIGKATLGDAAYLVHEIAEVKELERIKRETNFDFIKTNLKSAGDFRRWRTDFRRYYLLCHSKALEAEYEFIAEQIFKVSNGRIKISTLQAAAIDPTRLIGDGTEDTEAYRYLLVDGIPMKRHPNLATWRRKADQLVPLRKRAQQQLNYHRKQITLEDLIRYLKEMPIE